MYNTVNKDLSLYYSRDGVLDVGKSAGVERKGIIVYKGVLQLFLQPLSASIYIMLLVPHHILLPASGLLWVWPRN